MPTIKQQLQASSKRMQKIKDHRNDLETLLKEEKSKKHDLIKRFLAKEKPLAGTIWQLVFNGVPNFELDYQGLREDPGIKLVLDLLQEEGPYMVSDYLCLEDYGSVIKLQFDPLDFNAQEDSKSHAYEQFIKDNELIVIADDLEKRISHTMENIYLFREIQKRFVK